ANGILNVTAKDKATNKTQSVRIEGSTGLSKEEVERMKKEAEVHAVDDKKKQEMIEAKNLANSLIYTSEKTIRELGDKISVETKKEVEDKAEGLKKEMAGDNIEEIKAKTQDLSQSLQKIGSQAYSQAQEQEKKNQTETPKAEEAEYNPKTEPKTKEGEAKEKE
ncbi:Hsp70 family protein, partial [Patescibacteria group bacterium]|nr:Hsp70 family protein [Patescibacteria group bacterium]